MDWFMILLSPFVVIFVYPCIFLVMMYGTTLFLHTYRHSRAQIYDAYADNFWDGAMQTVAAVFDAHGTLWHGRSLLHSSLVLAVDGLSIHAPMGSYALRILKKICPCVAPATAVNKQKYKACDFRCDRLTPRISGRN